MATENMGENFSTSSVDTEQEVAILRAIDACKSHYYPGRPSALSTFRTQKLFSTCDPLYTPLGLNFKSSFEFIFRASLFFARRSLYFSGAKLGNSCRPKIQAAH